MVRQGRHSRKAAGQLKTRSEWWRPGLCLLVALLCRTGLADEIVLTNGDRLHGKLLRGDGDRLIFRHPAAGELAIPLSGIRRLETSAPVTVQTRNGKRLRAPMTLTNGILRLGDRSLPMTRIVTINPPPVPDTPAWKGKVNLGLDIHDGNQQTRRLHLDARIEGRREPHRLLFEGLIDRERSEGVETMNRSRIGLQYDRTLVTGWFLSANGRLEQDRFQDLRLRITLGGALGRRFIETARSLLTLEAGPSLVREDYYQATDRRFPTLGWKLAAEHRLLQPGLSLYHRHTGQLSLKDTEDLLIQSRTGLEWPLGNGFSTSMEVSFDWDNQPAPDRERIDTRYLFKLGYAW